MLGNAMVRVLRENPAWTVAGTIRSDAARQYFSNDIAASLISGVEVENHAALKGVFDDYRPQLVVNCVGLVKQLEAADDPLMAVPINSLLPHRLAWLCDNAGARLVHISTDCVFAGTRGAYTEADRADAQDLYGKTKFLGEVSYPNTITLRTSIIGHELDSHHGLVEWFLSQQDQCSGYTQVFFSGLPTVVLASLIRDVVVPRPNLSGVWHVAAERISKHDLLQKVAAIYGKDIRIVPDDGPRLDRSLDGSRFRAETGFVAPDWDQMIRMMHQYR